MKKILVVKFIGLFLGVTVSTSFAGNNGLSLTSADGNYEFTPSFRLQLQYRYVDSEDEPDTSGFFLRRGRVKFDGHMINPHLEYEVEFDFGTPDPGESQFDLKDLYLDYRLSKFFRIKGGQFKVPFGFQELTSSKKQQFVERSLASESFTPGRDIGLMFWGPDEEKPFEYYFGISNGEGDNSQSEDTKNLYSTRMVFSPFRKYKEGEPDLEGARTPSLTTGLESFYQQEAISDDYLLTWGGFLGYKFAGFSLRGEYFDRINLDDSSLTESPDAHGYYIQAGYFLFPGKLELAARQSEIFQPGVDDKRERSAAFNYYFSGHHAKLQLDYTRLVVRDNLEEQTTRAQLQIYF